MRWSTSFLFELPATIRVIITKPAPLKPEVTVRGWIKSVRAHKNVSFAAISDGSTGDSLQAVFKGDIATEHVTLGASVLLTGLLERSRGSGQEMELSVKHSTVLGICDPLAYPFQKKALPEHVLRENAHLRFRTTQTSAVMRVRDALARDWHDWFEDHEFVHIHTPILTASDCEGAGEMFTLSPVPGGTSSHPPAEPLTPALSPSPSSTASVPSSFTSSPSSDPLPTTASPSRRPHSRTDPFFPHPVNLTVSSQLHLECPTHSLARTYTLSPCLRAEPSVTSRHLSEFYMLEAELGFLDSLDQLLDVVEEGIKAILRRLLSGEGARHVRMRRDLAVEDRTGQMERGDLVRASTQPFTRLTYTRAIELLETEHAARPFGIEPHWGHPLSSEHEKWLAKQLDGPVFVTRHPKSLKPFYMLPSPDNSTVECFDLLLPGRGELAGGSLREHRLPQLTRAISEAGLDQEDYQWYLDLRRYGSVPHGGWGMGFDRWVCWITGIGNVRDVVPFPRWRGHCKY